MQLFYRSKYQLLLLLFFSLLFSHTQVIAQITFKKPLTFYVDRLAPAGGDGTLLHPFQKISTALITANNNNQQVIVNIISGSYIENLVITGNTTLIGIIKPGRLIKNPETILIGSVLNNTSYPLKIENLHISNAPAPGAIVVINDKARTILKNVTIERANRYGIYQQGGKLIINKGTIVFTSVETIAGYEKKMSKELVSYGTGIFIKNAMADLSNIILRSNQQGLVADGDSTNVVVTNMLVERHVISPTIKTGIICKSKRFNIGLSAVEVLNGATMQVQAMQILDNEFCGLYIHDGAKFTGADIIILRTKKIICTDRREWGGINAIVVNGGAYIKLSHFEIGYADLCGLQLINATGNCSDGKVHNNVIGININKLPAGFRYEDLMVNVIFQNNERNLDADILPIPSPDIPDFE